MKHITATIRRASMIATFLVVAAAGSAWAGCPPVDVNNCEMMHEEWTECEAAKQALRASGS